MGHRAIVLYELPSGLFSAHYSHWGACDLRLAKEINENQPLGGDKSEPLFATALVAKMAEAAGDDVEISGELAEATETTEVDPEPLAKGITLKEAFHDIVDYLHHEAVFVVRQNNENGFDVTAYRTYWLGLSNEPFESRSEAQGFLATVRWHNNEPVSDSYDRASYKGIRRTLSSLAGENGAVTRQDIDDVWPDSRTTYTDIDLTDILEAVQRETDTLDTKDGLFTFDAARELLRRMMLSEYDEDMDKYIHSESPVITEEDWKQYPLSFLKPRGMSRKLGEMYPTGYNQMDAFEVADEFDWPTPLES